MALLLAPYNASMQLGSGFNSYTQQQCISQAVVRDTNNMQAAGPPNEAKETAQSVVFKAELIEKTSDLTDSLNVNGSLNIKAAGVANGRGNGTFINSDKIRESDINFLITVKVVNSTYQDDALTKFVPLSDPGTPDAFTEIFGDCFISGYQIGGEFHALVSIQVHDKTQINKIKADAHIALTTPNFLKSKSQEDEEDEQEVAGDEEEGPSSPSEGKSDEKDKANNDSTNAAGKDSAGETQKKVSKKGKPKKESGLSIDADATIEKTRQDLQSRNTVTISVSWNGGGQHLKQAREDWNITTLRRAAARFPEMVAHTPVKTHAILTKYAALRSYWTETTEKRHSPLSYENVGVYTTLLQDAYMDYKNMYKNLQMLAIKVDSENKELVAADPKDEDEKKDDTTNEQGQSISPSTSSIADEVTPDASIQSEEHSANAVSKIASKVNTDEDAPTTIENISKKKPFIIHVPYRPSIFGIEKAKRDVRVMMSRIVLEVDLVSKHPEVVMTESRVPSFMMPMLFKQYLPKLKG